MKAIMFEGSVAEVAEMARKFGFSDNQGLLDPVPTGSRDTAPEAIDEMELARLFLERRPLADTQKAAISALVNSNGKWIGGPEIAAATGYSPSQYAGLMGALGRRFVNTQGWVEGAHVIDIDNTSGTPRYRARASLIAAWTAYSAGCS